MSEVWAENAKFEKADSWRYRETSKSPAKFSCQNSENREAVSKANAPTLSSITADVDKMEVSDTEAEYFALL